MARQCNSLDPLSLDDRREGGKHLPSPGRLCYDGGFELSAPGLKPAVNLLKEVLAHEVYPAFGCTEPISCAYAAATAAAQLGEPVESLR